MIFTEDSRVKIPTLLHLVRLGYGYISKESNKWDENTNIFSEIFIENIVKINEGIEKEDAQRLLEDVKLTIENHDLGKAFYEKLTATSGLKLIDFADFNKNRFDVVTELTYKNGDEEFRPDITLLVNGMPLVFIEVKKPNNKEGIIAERDRINKRFKNLKFRRFVNITQLMVFSNNMNYDDEQIDPFQGAFYASPSYLDPIFNYFREEEIFDLTSILKPQNEEIENHILKDNNLSVIKHSPEFITNKNPETPTNKICTSLFSKNRLAFLLRYGITYVKENVGLEKHIMRYPQIFATKAIEKKLNEGVKKGIIWHTQGSGKTALAYYNVRYLTDYFQKKSVIPKFYFIVDRIDLLTQAHREFTSRGLVVHTISSRDEFAKDIKTTKAIHNHSGKLEITVVNIQKFENDPNVVSSNDYDVNIQRIYFLDEVHRSYNPKGSFLANLSQSDINAIKIGLTGTPLLGNDYNSKSLFGNYIHKYYYNSSIADGYTLRLIREEIATSYKMQLSQILDSIEIEKNSAEKRFIYSHPKFVEPMLDYIVNDFEDSRIAFGDNSIGGMVICDSSDQAKKMYEIFQEKYQNKTLEKHKAKTASLILHDINDKEFRKDQVEAFKSGEIDLLFVYNMLLTGFDARRLKKLYLGRIIKDHNLLQALTRVNRTYKKFRYGYVVDFADIKKEFDKTNEAYLKELQGELGNEFENYSLLFKSREEINQEIEEIKDLLFRFDLKNAEIFSGQISEIKDREKIRLIKKALANAKMLYNLIRLYGHSDLLNKLDFKKLEKLYTETSNRLDNLNLMESINNQNNNIPILNVALEDIYFEFHKTNEEELILADKFKNILRITREAMLNNFDQQDLEFISLKEELERLFKKKNLNKIEGEDINENIEILDKIYDRIKKINRENNLLKSKYENDSKYVRIHKRLVEKDTINCQERKIFEALNEIKIVTDELVLQNSQILKNESYFGSEVGSKIIKQFNIQGIELNVDSVKYINNLIVNEYMNEIKNEVNIW
ncbi:MAG: type I restriction endonuclease subunit R [Rickettsiales bacterium]